ncbi:MAG: ATP-binding cassette domain-containing protein, partial [Clostridia bacterium]|nr:ATP-binding cassette domain-containing protein [Clostridia bacterium]
KANVGYVPQGTPLIEELSAKDNLRLWYGKNQLEAELKRGVPALLGVNEFINVAVNKMSGGMKKRLSIACAVASHPRLILLDEPSAALDIACKQNILNYLKEHKKAGGALVLVTHDPLELELCDRCFILKNGQLSPFTPDGNIDTLAKNI